MQKEDMSGLREKEKKESYRKGERKKREEKRKNENLATN